MVGGGGCFPGGENELVQHSCGPGQQATTCGFIVELDWVTVMVLGSVECLQDVWVALAELSSKARKGKRKVWQEWESAKHVWKRETL